MTKKLIGVSTIGNFPIVQLEEESRLNALIQENLAKVEMPNE